MPGIIDDEWKARRNLRDTLINELGYNKGEVIFDAITVYVERMATDVQDRIQKTGPYLNSEEEV